MRQNFWRAKLLYYNAHVRNGISTAHQTTTGLTLCKGVGYNQKLKFNKGLNNTAN